jgi:hypothetical protein
MALTIKFNITCWSCTPSHWMRGNSAASCVPTVTLVLTASPWVRAVTSRIAALRSATSFRGGAFLKRDPIRSTTSLARWATFTMPVSAALTSATSGGLLSKNRSAAAAYGYTAVMGCLVSWAIEAVRCPNVATRWYAPARSASRDIAARDGCSPRQWWLAQRSP